MNQLERTRAQEITKLHSQIIGHFKQSLQKVIRIGELVIEQKANLKHGEFGEWVKRNLPFTDRTARNYMRVYQERDRLKTEIVSDLKGAYALLTMSKEPSPKTENQNAFDKLAELKTFQDEQLEIAQNAAEKRFSATYEMGKILNDFETMQNENKRLLEKSDILLESEQDEKWFDKVSELNDEWERLFAWAAEYYPEFKKLSHRICGKCDRRVMETMEIKLDGKTWTAIYECSECRKKNEMCIERTVLEKWGINYEVFRYHPLFKGEYLLPFPDQGRGD